MPSMVSNNILADFPPSQFCQSSRCHFEVLFDGPGEGKGFPICNSAFYEHRHMYYSEGRNKSASDCFHDSHLTNLQDLAVEAFQDNIGKKKKLTLSITRSR